MLCDMQLTAIPASTFVRRHLRSRRYESDCVPSKDPSAVGSANFLCTASEDVRFIVFFFAWLLPYEWPCFTGLTQA